MKHYTNSRDVVDPFTGRLKSNKCLICGEDMDLPIHVACRKKLERKEGRPATKYTDEYIDHLCDL